MADSVEAVLATPDIDVLNVAVLVLRVYVGVSLAYHGYRKVAGGVAGTAGWFGSIGMRQPQLQAYAAIGAEIGGGTLLALGLLTPLGAAAIIGTMLVAGWVEHRHHFLILKNGWELVGAYAVASFVVASIGPGRFSLDNAFGIGWNGWTGMLIAGLLGIASGVGVILAFWRPADVKSTG